MPRLIKADQRRRCLAAVKPADLGAVDWLERKGRAVHGALSN